MSTALTRLSHGLVFLLALAALGQSPEAAAANQKPVVTWVDPAAASSTIPAGQAKLLKVNASDSDGYVKQVTFRTKPDNTVLCADLAAPFECSWTPPAGATQTFIVEALAIDGQNLWGNGVSRSITAQHGQPPTISITAPAANSFVLRSQQVTFSANASDPDGTVQEVHFYAQSTLLGNDTSAPYSVTWQPQVFPANTSLTAVAFDNHGNSTSTVITVKVNEPPAVSLTAPAANGVYSAGQAVSMTATASDTDGSVAKVDFYAGQTLVSSDTTSPYAATWSANQYGTVSLSAVATDNLGQSKTSSARSITVNTPQIPPTAAMDGALNGQVVPANHIVQIRAVASASQYSAGISKVEFYRNGTQKLDTDYVADGGAWYGFNWAVPAGTHQLTAKAYSLEGLVTTSAPITIKGNVAPQATWLEPTAASSKWPGDVQRFRVQASDADGSISLIRLLKNGVQIASATNATTLEFDWVAEGTGNHSFELEVRDNDQALAAITPRSVEVRKSKPVITLHGPESRTYQQGTHADELDVGTFWLRIEDPEQAGTYLTNRVSGQLNASFNIHQVGPPIQNGDQYYISWEPQFGLQTLTFELATIYGDTIETTPLEFRYNAKPGAHLGPAGSEPVFLDGAPVSFDYELTDHDLPLDTLAGHLYLINGNNRTHIDTVEQPAGNHFRIEGNYSFDPSEDGYGAYIFDMEVEDAYGGSGISERWTGHSLPSAPTGRTGSITTGPACTTEGGDQWGPGQCTQTLFVDTPADQMSCIWSHYGVGACGRGQWSTVVNNYTYDAHYELRATDHDPKTFVNWPASRVPMRDLSPLLDDITIAASPPAGNGLPIVVIEEPKDGRTVVNQFSPAETTVVVKLRASDDQGVAGVRAGALLSTGAAYTSNQVDYVDGHYEVTLYDIPDGRHRIFAIAWDENGGASMDVHYVTVAETAWGEQPFGRFDQTANTCQSGIGLDYCSKRVPIYAVSGAEFYCIWRTDQLQIKQCLPQSAFSESATALRVDGYPAVLSTALRGEPEGARYELRASHVDAEAEILDPSERLYLPLLDEFVMTWTNAPPQSDAPTISVTSPVYVQAGQSATITGSVADANGDLDAVELMSSATGGLLHYYDVSGASGNFSFPVSNIQSNTSYYIVARDLAGNASTVKRVDVVVGSGPTPATGAPVITLTSANPMQVQLGQPVTITGTLADMEGDLLRVDLLDHASGAVLGDQAVSGASGEFSFDVIDTLSGRKLKLLATDAAGNQRTSPIIYVLVGDDLPPPPFPEAGPDDKSDAVGAIAGQFRVDESGAATYSIPIFAVPGTAGVTPQLSLNYSSQGPKGPWGQGWSLSGVSSIARCRATFEAGDGADGGPISFTENDKFCLDGQRLLAAPVGAPACPPVGSMQAENLRTEQESFQRVCAYSEPNSALSSPRFFSVERTDGSVSFYGDRDGWVTTSTREEGYFDGVGPLADGEAMSWMQTRFRDSAGNFIDYRYLEAPGGGPMLGERLLERVEYTGHLNLSSPWVGAEDLAPYAAIEVEYEQRNAVDTPTAFVAGGAYHQAYRAKQIRSIANIQSDEVVRTYTPTYVDDRIHSIEECAVANGSTVCLPPTDFIWSPAKVDFTKNEHQPTNGPDFKDLISYRMGDIDGDGRQDIAWVKKASSGSTCPNHLFVAYGEYVQPGGSTLLSFDQPTNQVGFCFQRSMTELEESWHLLDYNGDGRDDLLFAQESGTNAIWRLHLGREQRAGTFSNSAFAVETNEIQGLGIPVPDDEDRLAQLADLDGNGLLDIVYSKTELGVSTFYARLMQQSDDSWAWGEPYTLNMSDFENSALAECDDFENGETTCLFQNFSRELGSSQLLDLNGDGRSDPLFAVEVSQPNGMCDPHVNSDPELTTLLADLSRTNRGGRLGENDPNGSGSTTGGDTGSRDLIRESSWIGQAKASLNAYADLNGAVEPCFVDSSYLAGFTVNSVDDDSKIIRLKSYAKWLESGSDHTLPTLKHLRVGDANGDGLTDVLRKDAGSSTSWKLQYNNGVGFNAPIQVAESLENPEHVQLLDVTGDGRADVVYPSNQVSTNQQFKMRRALPNLTVSSIEEELPGGAATACEVGDCEMYAYRHIFSDLDGDGQLDFVRFKTLSSGGFYAARATVRHAPRDVITMITNGFGAETELVYAPLTNRDVYRRDTNSRNTLLDSGRGSPVQDLLAPSYVVAEARSSAPAGGDALAKSSIRYRYAGAKAQAGGRGMLGFREIQTLETNSAAGGFTGVQVNTEYHQDFPFVGRPHTTKKFALTQSNPWPNDCLLSPERGICYQPNSAFSVPVGTLLSEAVQSYTSNFSKSQKPIFAYTDSSTESQYDLNSGALLSKVITEFTAYDDYGNLLHSAVSSYGAGDTALQIVDTVNVFDGDDETYWRLGRLKSSTVTHQRGAETLTRVSSFDYDMDSPTKTGLLVKEVVEDTADTIVNGTSTGALRTLYDYDRFGNRTRASTCSAEVSDTQCRSTNVQFEPDSPTHVQRYKRTEFTSDGRFALRSFEPFAVGERTTQEVLARNLLGDITLARDAQGNHAKSVYGAFGRAAYSWTAAIPGATPGNRDHGGESWTLYRYCGNGPDLVSCPAGAVFRRETIAEAAPRQWTYFDVLGRPIVEAKQSFQPGYDSSITAVCTSYDRAGRGDRTSNPLFLFDQFDAYEPDFSAQLNPCENSHWTTLEYDLLGRVVRTTLAGGPEVMTVEYQGLRTITTDPNGHDRIEVKTALGELDSATDAAGLTTRYIYQADGQLVEVRRNGGRGDIVSTFDYDGLGRKIEQSDPDAGTWNYGYNAAGELIWQSDAAGNRVENFYDARGRVWRSASYRAGNQPESESLFTFDDEANNGLGALASESISGDDAMSRSYRYDAMGRLDSRQTVIDAKSYLEQTRYDDLGRAFMAQDASGRWAKTEFNDRGFAVRVCDTDGGDTTPACPTNAFHMQVELVDARGNVVLERRGHASGPQTSRSFDARFGRLQTACSGSGCALQDDAYSFDVKGNLIRREHHRADIANRYVEQFEYDDADRLELGYFSQRGNAAYAPVGLVDIVPEATAPTQLSFYAQYDQLGNLCRKFSASTKHQFASYDYVGAAGCGQNGLGGTGGTVSQGHRLGGMQIPQAGINLGFSYDDNGNQTSANDSGTVMGQRAYAYSARNQARSIIKGSEAAPSLRARFWYGPGGARYKRVDDGSAQTASTKYYLGGVEREVKGVVVTWTRPVAGVVLQQITGDATDTSGHVIAALGGTSYQLYFDHLGSVLAWVSINGSNPTVAKRFDYDAHGESRPLPVAAGFDGKVPWRGFTGHEHLDGLNTIHMNGRIYDPMLGRFLQPDPVVQEPGNPQNWNPYIYVFNNPLSYTDPSGNIALRQVLGIAIAVVGTVFAPQFASEWAKFGYAVAVGATSGYASTGTIQGAINGAFSGALFFGIGTYFEGVSTAQTSMVGPPTEPLLSSGLSVAQTAAKITLHGAAGGVMSVLEGGKFGHGFASAGVTQALAPSIDAVPSSSGQVLVAALVGGTSSVLTGGKFGNGALTAAFSRALNDGMHRRFRRGAVKRYDDETAMRSEHVLEGAYDMQGMPAMDENGDGQTNCAELLKVAFRDQGIPQAKYWAEGRKIVPGIRIPEGTAIATFVDGKYPNKPTGNHAALYIGQGSEGIYVIDQWDGNYPGFGNQRIGYRLVPWNPGAGASLSNNGSAFSTIRW